MGLKNINNSTNFMHERLLTRLRVKYNIWHFVAEKRKENKMFDNIYKVRSSMQDRISRYE